MPATTNQEHFRVRIDATAAQGGTPVWGAAEDTNYSITISTHFRIRYCFSNSGGAGTTSIKDIFASRNAGAYAQVTSATTFVQSADATGGLSGDNSTISSQLLSNPIGSETFSGVGQYDFTGGTSLAAQNAATYSEFEYGLIITASASVGDTYDFRMYPGGVVCNGSYFVTPRITVISAASTIYAPLKQYLRR